MDLCYWVCRVYLLFIPWLVTRTRVTLGGLSNFLMGQLLSLEIYQKQLSALSAKICSEHESTVVSDRTF